MNFRRLRTACGEISPGVLQSRLHEWRRLDVAESIPRLGYRLTVRGEQLFQVLAPLTEWARAGDNTALHRKEKVP
jgi:DNA-binding HxlR family transcriptional regulator